MPEAQNTTAVPPTNTPAAEAGFAAGAGEASNTSPPGTLTITQPVVQATPPQTSNGTSTQPTWDMVERARQEEKDKLYPQLEEVRTQLTEFQRVREEELAAQQAAAAAAEEQARIAREAEMDARTLIETRTAEWDSRYNAMQQQLADRDALLAREREYSELQSYRSQVLAMRGDNILPELRDLVMGNSPDEIDRSVALLEERSMSILQNVAPSAAPAPPRGPSVTAPPVGPMETGASQRTYTAQELKDMPMSEYAQLRPQLLGAAGEVARSGGMYGR